MSLLVWKCCNTLMRPGYSTSHQRALGNSCKDWIWSTSVKLTNIRRPFRVRPLTIFTVGDSHMCTSAFRSWLAYVLFGVGVGETVNTLTHQPGWETAGKLREDLFCAGVCRCFPLSSSLPVFLYLSSVSRVFLCHRKPIYKGYLREVSPFVRDEIETLPSVALSVISSSRPAVSNFAPLSLRGHNSPVEER